MTVMSAVGPNGSESLNKARRSYRARGGEPASPLRTAVALLTLCRPEVRRRTGGGNGRPGSRVMTGSVDCSKAFGRNGRPTAMSLAGGS